MSEQAAHAAGPPGSAALPQHPRSPTLGQSPQPKPRTVSFSDDSCVSPNSLSNSVAASLSETSPAGRHPIYDGGALNFTSTDNTRPIGRFMVTEVGSRDTEDTPPKQQPLSRSRSPSESETQQLLAAPDRDDPAGKEPAAADAAKHPSIIHTPSQLQLPLQLPKTSNHRRAASVPRLGPIHDGAPQLKTDGTMPVTRSEPKHGTGSPLKHGLARLVKELSAIRRPSSHANTKVASTSERISDAATTLSHKRGDHSRRSRFGGSG